MEWSGVEWSGFEQNWHGSVDLYPNSFPSKIVVAHFLRVI